MLQTNTKYAYDYLQMPTSSLSYENGYWIDKDL